MKNGRIIQPLNKGVMDIQTKIEQWKLKPLSQDGRLIMTKSILLVLPIYLMSCYKFPKKLTSKLQKHISWFWKNKILIRRLLLGIHRHVFANQKAEESWDLDNWKLLTKLYWLNMAVNLSQILNL